MGQSDQEGRNGLSNFLSCEAITAAPTALASTRTTALADQRYQSEKIY